MESKDQAPKQTKYTNIEAEMMIDDIKRMMPYQMQLIGQQAHLLKHKYDELKTAGFTEEQTMEIVKTRPILEI